MRPAGRLVLALAACAAACSSFSASDTPTTTASDDAGAEASLPGSPDASPVDAAAPFVCPDAALLCDDFGPRNTLIGSIWDGLLGAVDPDASTIRFDDQVYASGPRSLRNDPLGAGSRAALYKDLPSTTTRVELAFSLRTEAVSSTQVHLVTVEFDPNNSYAQLLMKDGAFILLEQNRIPEPDGGTDTYRPVNAGEAPIGDFHRYTFIVDLTDHTLSLEADGATKILQLVSTLPPITRVDVGTTFTGGASSPHWIDDVVLTVR